MDLKTGTTISHYTILEKIAEGGMGTRAHDPKPVLEAAWNAGRQIMG